MTAPVRARHPRLRCSPRTQAAPRRRRWSAAPRPARSSWSRSPPRATAAPRPLASIGGTGVFVSALRDALLGGDVDVAVHSLKDLPTAPADGIALAAVPAREDPRDVVVARDGLTLGELPVGSARRHRLAPPGRPAARPRPRPRGRRHPRQRRHPVPQGPRRRRRRRRPRPCRPRPARAGWTRSPRCSTRCRCSRPPARARWRSSAAPTTRPAGRGVAPPRRRRARAPP